MTAFGLLEQDSIGSVKNEVLVVDVDRNRLRALQSALACHAHVDACVDFAGARARLFACPPRLLVTDSQLGAYNGLHLAYLAATVPLPTRVVVCGETGDTCLAREAKIAGAFYVSRHDVAAALPAYVGADLPSRDRRDVSQPSRRQQFRGGRRATDAAPEGAAGSVS